jgi:hypothetical protein
MVRGPNSGSQNEGIKEEIIDDCRRMDGEKPQESIPVRLPHVANQRMYLFGFAIIRGERLRFKAS